MARSVVGAVSTGSLGEMESWKAHRSETARFQLQRSRQRERVTTRTQIQIQIQKQKQKSGREVRRQGLSGHAADGD